MGSIMEDSIFIFVSPKEREFIRKFFTENHFGFRFYISGGSCNPIKYDGVDYE